MLYAVLGISWKEHPIKQRPYVKTLNYWTTIRELREEQKQVIIGEKQATVGTKI